LSRKRYTGAVPPAGRQETDIKQIVKVIEMSEKAKTTQLLMEWAINKIKTDYPDDVALLVAVEGASVNEDGHGEPFDYFVPATERGNELAQTFIINGVGSDLYPRSWERTERTAALEDPATLCLGDAKILYARSKEDEERFEAIRQTLFHNLADPAFTYRKALENMDVAMDLYRTMLFEERVWRVRCLAGYICRYAATAVACLNGTYWQAWHDGLTDAIKHWKNLPDRFAEHYKAILNAPAKEALRHAAHELISSARQFVAGYKPADTQPLPNSDYQWLKDWYQELRTTLNRLYYFCGIGACDPAFIDACSFQYEASIIAEEFGLGEMDVLGCFDAKDLTRLAGRAAELEKGIVDVIESKGVTIRRFDTVEAFIADANKKT